MVTDNRKYTEEEIKKAFWEMFHKLGSICFFTHYKEEDSEASTNSYWKEFLEILRSEMVKMNDPINLRKLNNSIKIIQGQKPDGPKRIISLVTTERAAQLQNEINELKRGQKHIIILLKTLDDANLINMRVGNYDSFAWLKEMD